MLLELAARWRFSRELISLIAVAGATDEQVEQFCDEIVLLLKYLDDKDTFQKYYTNFLALRLDLATQHPPYRTVFTHMARCKLRRTTKLCVHSFT